MALSIFLVREQTLKREANVANFLRFIRVIHTFAPIGVNVLQLSEDQVDGKHPLDGSMAKA